MLFRSSRPDLKNFTEFTGKHLCQSLFLNKVPGLRPATLLKRRLWHRCFTLKFANFLRMHFFIEPLWWLLLTILNKLWSNSRNLPKESLNILAFFPKVVINKFPTNVHITNKNELEKQINWPVSILREHWSEAG